VSATIPEIVGKLSVSALDEWACRNDPGVWAERRRGFVNAPFQWEWYQLVRQAQRLCVVAPRDHAKSEIFTVNATAWRSIYFPGMWSFIFADTIDQAKKLKERIDDAVQETSPALLRNPISRSALETTFSNRSIVTVAGSGKSVRGAHPDIIIGDDVLSEENTRTALQRKYIEQWWLGTVNGMTHPGTFRRLGTKQIWMSATRVFLIGTPFHQQDLLMSMRDNPIYRFRRYAAEYDPASLIKGLAIEVA
jgi:hypothetical protein